MKRVEEWFEEEGEDGIHPNDTSGTEKADSTENTENGIHHRDTEDTEKAEYPESAGRTEKPKYTESREDGIHHGDTEGTEKADYAESAQAGTREGKAKAVKSRKGAGGPKTAAGKARSAMNAVKHGLAARTPVLPGEDRGEFQEFAREHFEYLKPVGPIEKTIAHRLAVTAWRLQRAAQAECAAYSPEADAKAAKDEAAGAGTAGGQGEAAYWKRLRLGVAAVSGLSRHEGRLHRQYCRDMALYSDVQATRRAQEGKAGRHPLAGLIDQWGQRIGRYSMMPEHRKFLEAADELGLFGEEGPPP
jgi:hypothetical protein